MDPCEFSEDAIDRLDSKNFFAKHNLVKPEVYFEPKNLGLVLKPNGADVTISKICHDAAVLDKFKATVDYFKQLEIDGLSRIWLLSDSAENAGQISDLIAGDTLPASDIPKGMIDALLEYKICTRAQLELPEKEPGCCDTLKQRVNGWLKPVTGWLDA